MLHLIWQHIEGKQIVHEIINCSYNVPENLCINIQGCCLTGARAPGAPKLRVRATKFLFKEPGWAPKHRFSILI